MIFYWSLSDNISPYVFGTLLSILTDLNNAVVWMVLTRPLISKSPNPCTNPLLTVPSVSITIGTLLLLCALVYLFPSKVSIVIYRFAFFQFYPMVSRNGKVYYSAGSFFHFFCCWLLLGLVVWVRLGGPFVSQNPWEFCYYLHLESFSDQHQLIVFHWRWWRQVARTLFSIMTVPNNSVVLMVSLCPLIFKSSGPF